MKKENRVQKNVSPADAAAQLKSKLRHGEYARGRSITHLIKRGVTEPEQCDLEMAEIMVYQFVEKQFEARWEDACADLEGLYRSIKHHPGFSSVNTALEKIRQGDSRLAALAYNGRKVKELGGESTGYDPENWETLRWFGGYFEQISGLPFKDAVKDFWGFYGWIKDQTTFKDIAAAMEDILNADYELRMFVKKAGSR